MRIPRPYTLQSQFLAGLTVAAIVIGALFAAGFYFQMQSVLEKEVREKAELIFFQVESVQNYVRKTLRPRMYQEMPDKFVIEAMSSSFISRSIMEGTPESAGHLLYRRVAVDARNPDFEAREKERELMQFFTEHPSIQVWQGRLMIGGTDHFVMARPVRFESSCMYCHGDPETAPPELIAKYGFRGFGREEGSVGGLDFVGLPISAQTGMVQQKVMTYLIIFSLTAILFFLATHLIFKRVVVNNVRVLTRMLRGQVRDDKGHELLRDVQSRDELGEMIDGVEMLGQHISESRHKLEEYAATLEDKVRARTAELARETGERKADVDLFVKLLRSLHRSQTRQQLWRRALPLIAGRFGLARSAYVCTYSSQNFHVWPQGAPRPEMPDNWINLLTESRLLVTGSEAVIPVESTEGNTEGLLFLTRAPGEVFRDDEHELLRALGRLLGIAAEYLGALDNIVRHSEKLQSIFEGISDPLLLMDDQGSAIVTNEAARKLTRELSEGLRDDGNVIPLLCANQGGDGSCDIRLTAAKGVFEAREVRLSGGRVFVLGLHPVAGGGGNRVVVHVREVTAERQMLDQVTQSEKMATVGKLAAGLAHEINNPLGVILCYSELLKKSADDGQKEDLEVISRHTRQAREVLKNLLNFARPKIATDKNTDIGATMDAVARVFSVQAEKRGASIMASAADGVPTVRIDPQMVEHVVTNLMLNALDALPPQYGLITARTDYDPDGDDVVLTVEDNGTGIPEDHLPHIFEPFFTTKEAGKGTGLGLTVIYGFLQDMGGRVEVANRPEGGARFVVRFPVTPTPRAERNEDHATC